MKHLKNQTEDLRQIDLFLFMGQSNMGGRGVSSPRFPQKAPSCLPHAGYEFRAVTDPSRLYPLSEPFGQWENRPDGIYEPGRKTGSLVTAFVNAYYKKACVPVVAVSAARGGSLISQWLPGTPFFRDAALRLQDAVSFLGKSQIPIRHKFMVWCQGESDGKNKTPPEEYKRDFRTLLKAMTALGIEHCFLIRIGHYNPAAAEPGAPLQDYTPILTTQDQLAAEEPFITMVSTKFAEMLERGLMQDTYHYYQQAYNEVGDDAGSRTADFVKESDRRIFQ